jgi:hypothetical protein
MRPRIFLGWDPSQMRAWNVAAASLRRHALSGAEPERLSMMGLPGYTRPTELRPHGYWDVISQAPMSTAHAIARFFVPAICQYRGWALFTDGDVLFRRNVADLFALADSSKAIQVVQHSHAPIETVKMEGQTQTAYVRKNWSSVMLINCGHPAHRALTAELVNTAPGRDLHRFCWLQDELIGALPPEWNVLIGEEIHPDPALVHFTLGLPDMAGYEHQPFADEWYAVAAGCGYRLIRPAPPVEERSA